VQPNRPNNSFHPELTDEEQAHIKTLAANNGVSVDEYLSMVVRRHMTDVGAITRFARPKAKFGPVRS
tara:strand:+ start:19339 stop:19539 length:201 start_codon:yes stop_codon:yes gene_type:complete